MADDTTLDQRPPVSEEAQPAPSAGDLADIRRQVLARVQEEGAAESPDAADPPKLTHDQVAEYLAANELGDGLIFATLFRNRHAYVGQSGEWIRWAGHHWRIDDIGEAHYALADVESVAEIYDTTALHYSRLAKDAEDGNDKQTASMLKRKAEALRSRVSKLRSDSGRQRCLRFARTNRVCPLAITGDEIDTNPWALPVANGVLDLKTGELAPGRPGDYLLKASPVEWQGIDAPCPEWERFVLEIMDGDAEMAAFLQRAFGYGITGLVSEQKFLVLYGKGRNGKGVLTEVLQEIMGGSDAFGALAGPVQSEMLLDQGKARNAAGPSPDIMGLRGMRLAFASETDEGQRFSSARVKWLSGADRLTGRYPHDKRNITFDPTHFLVLLTNNKPHAPANDFAFWERVLLVKFPLSFVDRKPQTPNERPVDKGLRERLRGELPGILAWLVRGCLAWQEQELAPPPKVLEAVAEYQREEDYLGDFLEECCELVPDDDDVRTTATELYEAFLDWFHINISAKKDMSQKKFGKLMQERCRRERVGGRYYYYGVSLRPEALDELEAKKPPARGGGGGNGLF